jgi:transcription antitermination factor NusG
LRQYNTENWDLSKSKDKAEEMLDKGKIMVKVHSSNFMAFSAEIKQLNLYLETYNL